MAGENHSQGAGSLSSYRIHFKSGFFLPVLVAIIYYSILILQYVYLHLCFVESRAKITDIYYFDLVLTALQTRMQ